MASSLSLTNFPSFLSPSNPRPKTPAPSKVTLPSPSTHFLSLKKSKDCNLTIPLVAHEGHSGSSPLPTDLSSVIYPSLTYANILFSRPYNVRVIVEEDEPEEKLLNRFRREVMKAGIIQECKRRRFFESKQEKRKRKSREAAKRNRKRRPQSRASTQNKQEVPASKKADDSDDDNWELPEGELPY